MSEICYEPHEIVSEPSVFSQKSLFPFHVTSLPELSYKKIKEKKNWKICANISTSFSLKVFASRSLPISKPNYSTSRNLTHSFWAITCSFPTNYRKVEVWWHSQRSTELSLLNKYQTSFFDGERYLLIKQVFWGHVKINSELIQDRKKYLAGFYRNCCQKTLRRIILSWAFC